MPDWLFANYLPDPLIEGAELPVSFHPDCAGGSGGSGGTVGCGCYIQGHGIPSAAPTLPLVPYYYTNLDDGVGFYWDVELQQWA